MTSTILLSHLQTSNSRTPTIPLPTLQSALSNHLSTAPSTSASTTTLTVTQLTATAISSPFFLPRFQPFEYARLQAFETAFRHAVHLLRQQQSKQGGANLSRWTGDVIKGIQGGHSILRLAACGGILLGVEDLKKNADVNENWNPLTRLSRNLIESELVVALAEVLDSTTVHTEWEDEFQHQGQPQYPSQQRPVRNTLLQAFILASHFLLLIDSQRLTALPLHTLARLLTKTLVSFFDSPNPNTRLNLQPNSVTITDLSHVPSLAKLTSGVLTALLDSSYAHTYTRTLSTVSDTCNTLLDLSRTIEQTHATNPSSQIPKQFLLTSLIIFQSVLYSIVYLPPHITKDPDTSITPPSLALITLCTLTHLSLAISQFGGITNAFEQLQKVFYLSIDILLAPSQKQKGTGKQKEQQNENVEAFVQHLSHFLQSQSPEAATTVPFRAKLSFSLSTFEQLVPLLSPHCIINHVWSVCYPYLTNPSESNREIYESAHSVVLSMLVHYPQRHQDLISMENEEEEMLWTEFIQRLVPFYAQCLVEDTTLTILQLRHAYSALVQCAGTVSTHIYPSTTNTTGVVETATAAPLQWYCVQLILDAIDALSSSSPSGSCPPPPQSPLSRNACMHRLHLILVSTLPSLPLNLLERCLESVRGVIVGYSREVDEEEGGEEEKGRRRELAETLFELLLSEQMGQGEKKAVGMKWWYENLGLVRGMVGKDGVGDGRDKEGQGVMLTSRL